MWKQPTPYCFFVVLQIIMWRSLLVIVLAISLAGEVDGLFGWFWGKGRGHKKGKVNRSGMIGCYEDTARRMLEGGRTVSNRMSIHACRKRCQRENTKYFGVENGNECHCGSTMRYTRRKSLQDCRKKCTGSKEACGGGWRILVYKNRKFRKTSFIPTRGRVGCYVDRRYRTLGGAVMRSRYMTVSKCINFCKRKRYRYAGVEHANECFCGNALRYRKKVSFRSCRMPCRGYKKQACGGRWRICIYKTGCKNDNKCGRFKKCHANAKCVHGECRCKKGFTGDGVRLCYKTCTCTASGDPHYKTYDGSMIHFMGVCKYTLSKVKNGLFVVEVKNEYHGRNRRVSYTRLVDVKLGRTHIRLHKRHQVFINGLRTYLPYKKGGLFNIIRSGCKIRVTIKTKYGKAIVTWDGSSFVSVTIPKPLGKYMRGLCGNCNGRRDDYKTKYGKDVSRDRRRDVLIGNSYTVKDDTDQIHKSCKCHEVRFKCTPELRKKGLAANACGYLNPSKKSGSPFRECLAESPSTSRKLFENCLFDFCSFYTDKVQRKRSICQSVAGYAEFCGNMGITAAWRSSTFCPLPCGKNMRYDAEMSGCPASCVDPTSESKCDQPATEGCRCVDGFILSDNKCVKREECGCKGADSLYYPLGTTFTSADCKIVQQCKFEGGKTAFKTILQRPGCGELKTCVVTNGSPTCVCKTGYIQNGRNGCLKESPTCQNEKATVKCSSSDAKKKVCTVPNAKTVVHVRPSITSKVCRYGSTYGMTADGVWVSEGCAGSFSVCFVKVPPPSGSECLAHDDPKGAKYTGTMSTTESGYTCQNWSSQKPHSHTLLKTENHNFCRNPDNEPEAWCYTTDPKKRFDFCKIPICSVDVSDTPVIDTCLRADDGKGLNYKGLQNTTKSGLACQEWGRQRPHGHSFMKLAGQKNYCRNPDNEAAPWCYTTSAGTRWEYCNIPDCGQCEIEQERRLDCKIVYKVSGKCFFASSAVSKCKFNVRMTSYKDGISEATIETGGKSHVLTKGKNLRTCATFEMQTSVLTIVEDICSSNCVKPTIIVN